MPELDADPLDQPEPEGIEPPRKRRPRKGIEEPGEPVFEVAASVAGPIRKRAEKAAKGQGKGNKRSRPQIRLMCDCALVGAFQVVDLATNHEHWKKSQADVAVATEPLQGMIEQLPAKTLKAIEARLYPILFTVGMGMLIVPDAITEIKLRRLEAEAYAAGLRAGQQQGRPIAPRGPMPGPGGPDVNGAGPAPQPNVVQLVSADPRLRGLDG